MFSLGPAKREENCDFGYILEPVQPLQGIAHPAYDYFFLQYYLLVEVKEFMEKGLLPNWQYFFRLGYCQGWFESQEEISKCADAAYLWNEHVESFFTAVTLTQLYPQNLYAIFNNLNKKTQN
jgi:hypothetical protein